MIIGVGTDIVRMPRIEEIYQKYGSSFLMKILDSSEIEQFNRLKSPKNLNFLAKRFAAKEAISKALGEGIGRAYNFRDIIVTNNEYGKPEVLIKNIKLEHQTYQFHLSLSDDYPIAVAFVVISS